MHIDAGAKMVPFAGYNMPVQYPAGIIKEHQHSREKAGLFDVSHMGQISLRGTDAAQKLERLVPVDILGLGAGKQRYALFLNEHGCVLDDLMIAKISDDHLALVVNAACKEADFEHLKSSLGAELEIEMHTDRSLLALQGPTAKSVLARLGNDLSDMNFMAVRSLTIGGIQCGVTRSGYTGEDGFEISIDNQNAASLAELLLKDDDVEWVGLGARDSLRLEAGLCLYGHDMDEQTSPIEAGLSWAISKARRLDGERSGGFPGAEVILPQMPRNVDKLLVGLQPQGRAPIREGALIENADGTEVGVVTSGGFSPSLGKPICMGYVNQGYFDEFTELNAIVRDKRLAVVVTKLPFVKRRYFRLP